ncbi:MAG: response regulator [Polyangiaceae bacterium]|nr:response regulator [Polyangiaceae bacterium]
MDSTRSTERRPDSLDSNGSVPTYVNRLQVPAQYAALVAAAWSLFGVYRAATGNWSAAGVDALIAVICTGGLFTARRRDVKPSLPFSIVSGATLAGGVMTAATTQDAAAALMFIPLVPLVSALLYRRWERLLWLALTLTSIGVSLAWAPPAAQGAVDRAPAAAGLSVMLHLFGTLWRREADERLARLRRQNTVIEAQARELASARDEAVRASAAKSRYVAVTSHELRGPLGGIVGMAASLGATKLTTAQRDLLNSLSSSADSLTRLLQDLLEVARIEAGRVDVLEAAYEPRELVADVADQFADPAARKSVELVHVVAPDVPHQLEGDAGRLRQIVTNLVSNAIKFTSAGSVTIEVRADDDHLVYEVVDTGKGLGRQSLETIFAPFEQVSDALVDNRLGTGLGLWIARSIAEALGGTLDVESAPARGSTFRLRLPLKFAGRVTPPQSQAFQMRPSVLVVAGSAASARSYAAITREIGVDATIVRTITGLAMGTHPRPEVIVLDPTPGHDELTQLKARFPNSAFVLAATPLSLHSVEELARAIAATSMLVPARASRLAAGLSRALGALPREPSPSTAATHLTGNLLVVDDDPVNRKVARLSAESLGMSVDEAASGEEALQIIQAAFFDVVLMDVHLDGISGLETTARLTRNGHASRGPVVLGYTGALDDDMRKRCQESGMFEVMGKPYTLPDFAAALQRAFRARRGARATTLGNVPVLSPRSGNGHSPCTEAFQSVMTGHLTALRDAIAAEDRVKLRSLADIVAMAAHEAGTERLELSAVRLRAAAPVDEWPTVTRRALELERHADEAGAALKEVAGPVAPPVERTHAGGAVDRE